MGRFFITSEEAIAKGVRRIVAVTGPEADRALQKSIHYETDVKQLSAKVAQFKDAADRPALKQLNSEITSLNQVV